MQTHAEEKERHRRSVDEQLFSSLEPRRLPRQRPAPTGDQLRAARRYATVLGITGAPRVYIDGRFGWYAGDRRLSTSTVARGIAGRYGGLAVAGLEHVAFLVVDVDLGHERHAEPGGLDEFLAVPRSVRRRRLTSRAERRLLRRIRLEFPRVHWLPIASPRGLHLLAILAEPLPAAHAAALAEHVLTTIGRPERVEAFPKLENGKARTCGLPLTRGRLLDETLEQRRHRLRHDDLADLLAAPRAALGDFGIDPRDLEQPRQPTRRDRNRASPVGRRSPAPATRGNPQLFKADFAAVVRSYLRDGIADDHGWDAVGKLSFALRVGFDLAPDRCVAAFGSLLERGDHGSSQAQTRAGRGQLLRVFRSTLKHHERGIATGRLEPGRMVDAEISGLVAELLGERRPAAAKRADKPFDLAADLARKQRVIQARRAAACRRWARPAAPAASASEQEFAPCRPSPEKPAVTPSASKPAASVATTRCPTSKTSTPSSPHCKAETQQAEAKAPFFVSTWPPLPKPKTTGSRLRARSRLFPPEAA